MRFRQNVAGAIVVVSLAVSPALGATVSVNVPGSANPYLAGMPNGSACCAGSGGTPDSAPAQSPVQVNGLALAAGAVLTFSVTGSVNFMTGAPPTDSPDGGVFNMISNFGLDGTPPNNGIAGMLAPQDALVGLFLDDSVPTSSGAPPRLDFSSSGIGTNFPTLSPGLKQPFFIGDGMTGTGTGAVQQFVVPAGATRFFLGTVDGVEWAGNTGGFSVQVTGPGGAAAGPLAAAILPGSRSLQVGETGTVFATILNAGSAQGVNCGISPTTNIPATFSFQTTNASNVVIGSPNAKASVPPNAGQTFVLAFTPTAPFGPTDVTFAFQCDNTGPAAVTVGVNTLLLSGSNGSVPDVIAVGATVNNDGITNIPGANGTGFFTVATFNLGAGAQLTASADTGGANIPVNVFICQTDAGGNCMQPPAPSVTLQVPTNATPTFAVFGQGHGNVPFDPAHNRLFFRMKEGGGATRSETSTAVRTQ